MGTAQSSNGSTQRARATRLPRCGLPWLLVSLCIASLILYYGDTAVAQRSIGAETKTKTETIRLAGPITPRIRYAGYLLAKQYALDLDSGFSLEFAEMPESDAIRAVAEGDVEFGIAPVVKLVKARGKGQPIVLVAAILQHSPNTLLVHPVSHANDLAYSARHGIFADPSMDLAEFHLMFKSEGFDSRSIHWSIQPTSIEQLAGRDYFSLAADSTVLPYLFEQEGCEVTPIRPRHHTISMYGDCLFCNADFANNHDSVERFLRVVQLAWRRTFTHPGRTISDISKMQENGQRNAELLAFELKELSPLVLPNVVEIGHVNPRRVARIANRLASLGELPDREALSGFLYQPNVVNTSSWDRWGKLLLIAVGCGTLVLGFVVFWNLSLRRRVARRTILLEEEVARRCKAEDLLKDANETLENTIELRTRELTQVNSELDAYAHSIAHDLRAPLRAMYGFARILREDYSAVLGKEGREYTEFIESAAREMDALTRNILEYSRIGRQGLPSNLIDLDDVVRLATKQMHLQILECGANIDVKYPLGMVAGHHSTMVCVLSNLISNAIKFVGNSVTPEVKIWSETVDAGVRLWVEDNGIGIAPEFHDRIFEVFERLHEIDDRQGNGIGLAIVKRAVESTGGRFGVDSQAGQGSRFWLELCVVEQIENQSRSLKQSPHEFGDLIDTDSVE